MQIFPWSAVNIKLQYEMVTLLTHHMHDGDGIVEGVNGVYL